MSVLIKGMDMPTSSRNCPFTEMDDWDKRCIIGGKYEWHKDRPCDNCPLVPVSPHGRLIDADALTAKFKEIGLGEHSLIERLFADGVYVMIDYAPTIIPAESEV